MKTVKQDMQQASLNQPMLDSDLARPDESIYNNRECIRLVAMRLGNKLGLYHVEYRTEPWTCYVYYN